MTNEERGGLDDFLNQVISKREKEMGATGRHRIIFKVFGMTVLKIHSLSYEAARQVFDLVDEYHYTVFPIKVLLLNEKEEIMDEAHLPNVFNNDL